MQVVWKAGTRQRKLETCPDKGASHSMMGRGALQKLGLEHLINQEGHRYSLNNASEKKMDVIGLVKLWIHILRAPSPKLIYFIV